MRLNKLFNAYFFSKAIFAIYLSEVLISSNAVL